MLKEKRFEKFEKFVPYVAATMLASVMNGILLMFMQTFMVVIR